MSLIFRWLFMAITMLALIRCRAFPTSTANITPERPEILYVHNGKLMRQSSGQVSQAILTLPDMGTVKDALKVDDTVFVLCEWGVQKVLLADHKVEIVEQFSAPIREGALFATDEYLFYSIADKVLRQYDIVKGTTRTVLSYPHDGFFRPLGLTQDRKGVYLLPLAGDPEFPTIWKVELTNGEVTELPIGLGLGEAALSPDRRQLAILAVRIDPIESLPEYGLGLFNMSTSPPTGRFLTLPNPPSHMVDRLVWSPNSERLYFLLRPGEPWELPTTSYGLWQFEVASGTFSRIANIDNPTMHLVSLVSNGKWALLRPETERYITLVHTVTGDVSVIELPTDQIELVRYQITSRSASEH